MQRESHRKYLFLFSTLVSKQSCQNVVSLMDYLFHQEERRVVYVGRIRGTMTQKELRERFSFFGEIEECTLHFRDQGYVHKQLL